MFARSDVRWRRVVFLGTSAAITLAVIVAAHDVLLPFVLAVVIAYVLTPLVVIAERRRVPRPIAVLLVYAVVVGSFGAFVRQVAPRIAQEFRNLRGELPVLANEARDWGVPFVTNRLREIGIAPSEPMTMKPGDSAPTSAFIARPQADGTIAIDVGTGINVIERKNGWQIEPVHEHKEEPFDAKRIVAEAVGRTFAYAEENSLEVARALRDLITKLSRIVFVFFITLMLAATMIVTRERVYEFFRTLARPSARPAFDALFTRIDHGLSGVVRGQLVICGINGVLSAVGFGFVGLKYWPVMALMAAIFSLIPIFGSIASAVPAVAIGLSQSVATAAFVLGWVVAIHQLEANALNPKIMGDSAKIHPVLVIFALLVGEHFFQLVGALLAVPTMSIAQSVFLHFREATAPSGDGDSLSG